MFFLLTILPMERSSDSQSYKKIIGHILGYISFCFEIRTHLGHLFTQTLKIIKFNRWKKWAKHKVKSYIRCINQYLHEKHHEKWDHECKQRQFLLFNICNVFDLLTSRIENDDFYIFSHNDQLRKTLKNFIYKFLLYHTSLS